MKELKQRKATRLKGADYNRNHVVFLTVCTKDRICLLSRIVGTGVPDGPNAITDGSTSASTDLEGVLGGIKVELTEYGQIAEKYITQLNTFYDDLSVESYVIMPNHIHILLSVNADNRIRENGPSRTPVPTRTVHTTVQNSVTARFLSTFKRFCNKEYGMNIWQYRSYDHIIRNRKDYEAHLGYIYENPMKWYTDDLYVEESP